MDAAQQDTAHKEANMLGNGAPRTTEVSQSEMNGVPVESTGAHVALEVEAGNSSARAHANEPPAHFPWQPDMWTLMCRFLLSSKFTAAVQLAGGTLVVSLFAVVDKFRFGNACLATIFFVAAMLLISNDTHLGSRIAGTVIILGPLWFGSAVAGAVISLAHAPGVAYTTFLCVFTAIGLIPLTGLRVKGNLGVGVVSNLGFGIMLIYGQFTWPAKPLWEYVFTRVIRMGCVACLGVIAAGLFVLPSLAGDDMRKKLADVCLSLGATISEEASRILVRDEDAYLLHPDLSKEDRSRHGQRTLRRTMTSDVDDRDKLDIERSSKPMATLPSAASPPTRSRRASVANLRPQLGRCRELFRMAALEPPFVRLHGFKTFKWVAVMDALDTLVMRTAALESLMEGEDPLQLDRALLDFFGVSLLQTFRLMFAQVAAACMSASRAINEDIRGVNKHTRHKLLFQHSWAVVEYELAGTMHLGMKAHWGNLKASQAKDFVDPPPEVRALLYLGTIGNGIMESLAAFENALTGALVVDPPKDSDTAAAEKLAQPVLDAIATIRDVALGNQDAKHKLPNLIAAVSDEPAPVSMACQDDMVKDLTASQQEIAENAESGQPSIPPRQAAFVSFKRSFTTRPIQKLPTEDLLRPRKSDLRKAKQVSVAASTQAQLDPSPSGGGTEVDAGFRDSFRDRFLHHFGWALPLIKAALAIDAFVLIWEMLSKDIPQRLSSPKKIARAIWQDRWLQFGLKFYAASTVVLLVLVTLQANYPGVRSWNGLYMDITIAVVLSEKVDTTVMKGFLRITTTVVGATLGFLVMLDTKMASNPYGLVAVVCAFAFLCGFFAMGPLKYAVFLTIISFDSVILCQYNPYAHVHGSVHSYYTRMVVTIWGVLLCLVFDLIWPWYASSDALDALGKSFQACGEICEHFLDCWNEELEIAPLVGRDFEEANEDRIAGIEKLEEGILNKRIAGPLGATQAAVAREGVLWKTGLLSLPPIVAKVISLLQAVLDRLAAFELMLLQKPIVSGRYSGAPWQYLQQPLQAELKTVMADIQTLAKCVRVILGEYANTQDVESLEVAITALKQSRLLWRAKYRAQLAQYFVLIGENSDAPYLAQRTVDDSVRFQSTLFALAKALDKMTMLARMVAADPWLRKRAAHNHSWSVLHTWLGK